MSFRSTKLVAPAAKKIQARSLLSYHTGLWSHVPSTPLDAIKALTEAYKKDPSPNKVTLGEGVYRDNEGKPVILKSVREAERIIYEKKMDHEYAAVSGIPAFCAASAKFAFGADSKALAEKRVATSQALSGTGALRMGADFLHRFVPANTLVYMPSPTWVNHNNIFKAAGFDLATYRYYDKANSKIDMAGLLEDLKKAPKHSIILLHACAHNPTGLDPTLDQWKQISDACKERQHIVFFDVAYQGFASGDPEKDAQSFRLFVAEGHNPIVTQSYAKNFGLYGERVGAINVVCSNPEEAEAVDSQLKVIARANYSNPPIFGARIVQTVLENPELKKQWEGDVKEMADRIATMRKALVDNLYKAGSKKDWSHITNQIGMFAFSGLTPEQVKKLKEEYHIYLTNDGRISISGINTNNVEYLAKAFHEVSK